MVPQMLTEYRIQGVGKVSRGVEEDIGLFSVVMVLCLVCASILGRFLEERTRGEGFSRGNHRAGEVLLRIFFWD